MKKWLQRIAQSKLLFEKGIGKIFVAGNSTKTEQTRLSVRKEKRLSKQEYKKYAKANCSSNL